MLLADHVITGFTAQVLACPGKVVQVKSTIHMSLVGLVGWLYLKHLLDVMTS